MRWDEIDQVNSIIVVVDMYGILCVTHRIAYICVIYYSIETLNLLNVAVVQQFYAIRGICCGSKMHMGKKMRRRVYDYLFVVKNGM